MLKQIIVDKQKTIQNVNQLQYVQQDYDNIEHSFFFEQNFLIFKIKNNT